MQSRQITGLINNTFAVALCFMANCAMADSEQATDDTQQTQGQEVNDQKQDLMQRVMEALQNPSQDYMDVYI